MAKKKIKLKSIFKTKLTKVQIIFSVIFLIIIFLGLGLFFFSTNTGLQYRMLLYSQELQAKNNYYDYTQSLTPTPAGVTKPTPTIVSPEYTPNPRQLALLRANENSTVVGEVEASRSVSSLAAGAKTNFTPLKEITDHATAQVLYDTIVALPPYPTPPNGNPIAASCVANAQRVLYDLTFLNLGNKPLYHAVVSMTPCGGEWWVTLDGSYKREFSSDIHLSVPLRSLLESSFGLTSSQLDGF